MKKAILLISTLFFVIAAFANGGHTIKVQIKNFTGKEIYFGYPYGDKEYLRDTAVLDTQGYFVFAGEEELPGGVYLIVMPPNNEYFQILLNKGEQNLIVSVNDPKNPMKDIKIEGSSDNNLLYEYLNYLAALRPQADTIRAQIARASDEKIKESLQKKLDAIDKDVVAYQNRLVEKHPKTLSAAIIRANIPMDQPEFQGDTLEIQRQRWRYSIEHFFDNLDLGDPRMLRTPKAIFFDRIDYYVNKLQVQHPDSLSQAVDYVLNKMKPAEETFKYYLIHFLNYFAKSQYVGMDAVYVHLVNEYYAKGLAPWTDAESLKKIIENAKGLEPTLIGKIIPDVTLEKRDSSKISLHSVDAEYIILYIWSYSCGTCKKATPVLKEFNEKFKDKGVKIFAICNHAGKEVAECWKYVDENGNQDWIHTADPYRISNYQDKFYVKSTPTIYVLDKNKEIISKRIGAEQLDEIMTRIIEAKK
ncbi:MAG: thioredoxin-like domain-containing protein [Saprospiraceae bacterium]|nr:thioredoxin-like domain-containing protein [Saprospiraceae bacterium]